MDGKRWLKNSISIWSDIKKSKIERNLSHPAIFPVMLVERLLECFSIEDDFVLDPFVGSGSTLIGAWRSNRYSLGLDLKEEYKKEYEGRKAKEDNEDKYEPDYVVDNAVNVDDYVDKDVDLTISSFPYWDIMNRDRTADNKGIRNYGNKDGDVSNIKDYNKFLGKLKNVFNEVYNLTSIGGYCCLVVMDIRKKDKFYPLHMDVSEFMRDIGFELDDIIIWDRRDEYNNLKPLGYPYVFRVNKVHEFIMIFQKRG